MFIMGKSISLCDTCSYNIVIFELLTERETYFIMFLSDWCWQCYVLKQYYDIILTNYLLIYK